MKKKIVSIFLVTVFMIFTSAALYAQNPPPPPPDPSGSGGGNLPVGGGAPIGSGLVIFLALGAAYGGKKVYDARKETA